MNNHGATTRGTGYHRRFLRKVLNGRLGLFRTVVVEHKKIRLSQKFSITPTK
ncbi:MAG TPA: hypothetical protein PLR88_10215 [Bacteroidales bacterium]|nr:hypothetical protein [Bacteroidales bacterium]